MEEREQVEALSSKKKANKKDKKNEGGAEDYAGAYPSTEPKSRYKGVRLENGQDVTTDADNTETSCP